MDQKQEKSTSPVEDVASEKNTAVKNPAHKLDQAAGEIGGPGGLEPTRYGDWERKGIVSDF